MTPRRHPDEHGQALLLTLIITALVAPLGVFALMQARVDLLLARYSRTAAQLFYVADSGLDHALADLRLDPVFDRLPLGPDGKDDTKDDGDFPFHHNPPDSFPDASFGYTVKVEPHGEERIDIVSRGIAESGGSQTVSASVVRDRKPMVPGAICSTVGGGAFALGDDFRVSGIDRSQQLDPIPALALADEGAVSATTARLSTEETARLPGAGGTPSVRAGVIPDLNKRIDSLLADPRARIAVVGERNSLGSGLLVSHGILYLDSAFGSGILLVDGDLRVTTSFTFDGLVLVRGDVLLDRGSSAQVHGALVQGGNGVRLELLGSGEIIYDSKVIEELERDFAGILPHRAIVTGWREVWE
jgi:hypothetical protein